MRCSRVLGGVLASMLVVVTPGLAAAHEQRGTGGRVLVVGWVNEPTFTGLPNGVQVLVRDGGGNPAAADAELQVEVTFGDERSGPMPLDPVFGRQDELRAPLIPTRPGDYTFRIFGTLNGEPVDESFTSGPDTFDPARDAGEIHFPVRDPSPADLSARVDRLSAQADEQGSTGTAMWIAVLAAVLAAAALVTGVAAIRG